jgi:hypothetical protein
MAATSPSTIASRKANSTGCRAIAADLANQPLSRQPEGEPRSWRRRRRADQPVLPRHHEHVASLKPPEHLGQFGAVRAPLSFSADTLAPPAFDLVQLGILRGQALPVGGTPARSRKSSLSESHFLKRHMH